MRKRTLLRPLLVLAGLVGAGTLVPLAISQAAAVEHTETYRYGSHARQALDAYWNTPKEGIQPGIVIVHGGYWNSGRRTDWKSTAEWYAQRGFAVFAVDHRYNTDAPWPAPRDDLYQAITWIKSHAGTFRLDRDRIAVIGSQAGGHLATQAGTHAGEAARVRAVVGLSAVVSPERAYREAQSATDAARRALRDQSLILAGCTPLSGERYCLNRFRDMDSAAHAGAGDPPMLLIHSSGDAVPASHGESLKQSLAAAGVHDVTVRTVPGSASGGSLLSASPELRTQILEWIRSRTGARSVPSPQAPSAGREALAHAERVPSSRTDDDGALIAARTPVSGRVERTFSYGPHRRHKITAYFTRSKTPRPAVVLIHGGYWYEGDKSSYAGFARQLADKGYAAFAINYRLNTQARWAAQRRDVLTALRWVRSRAARFAVDPARIVVVGNSAGGHLASIAGTHSTSARLVKAVAATSPVANPYRAYLDGQKPNASAQKRKLRDAAVLLAGCTPNRNRPACWRRWVDMVSFQHVSSGDAPMFLVHSKRDFVPPVHSAQLCRHLRARSVKCTRLTVAGNAHGMAVLSKPAVRNRLLKWIKANA